MQIWSVPRLWPGDAVFVVAGGPSFTREQAELLRGRRVIAINSAWRTVPFADVLLFGDRRWWMELGQKTTGAFAGELVTTSNSVSDPRVRNLYKLAPPKWATDPRYLTMKWTTATAAVNFACHAGAAAVALLGLDGRDAPGGRRHNHDDRYPWPPRADSYQRHADEFKSVARAIAAQGVTVVNCSPGSAHDCWPKRPLEEML